MNYANDAINDGKIVIDLSADFRIKDKEIYENWYKVEHKYANLLKRSVFGLPEVNRKNIKRAKLIANPGCYATSIIIPLYPLLAEKIIHINNIIIDSKSGVSGAGKKLETMYLYNEQNENFFPYNPEKHRHIPEVIEFLNFQTNSKIDLIFVPHLLPLTRGILSSIYLSTKEKFSYDYIRKIYEKYYTNEFFIRILPENIYPQIRAVANTNFCDIGFICFEKNNKILVFSAIDNLIKGASGQAIQNVNIILGLDEKTGLI
jgi:N-acetyl-gamma-glutamyl-phosphate reductase